MKPVDRAVLDFVMRQSFPLTIRMFRDDRELDLECWIRWMLPVIQREYRRSVMELAP